jgi:hypothetical protein
MSRRAKARKRHHLRQIQRIQIHVVVVIAVAVEVAADVVSHRVMELNRKRVQMTRRKILLKIQKKAQRARHIVAVVAVVQPVKM